MTSPRVDRPAGQGRAGQRRPAMTRVRRLLAALLLVATVVGCVGAEPAGPTPCGERFSGGPMQGHREDGRRVCPGRPGPGGLGGDPPRTDACEVIEGKTIITTYGGADPIRVQLKLVDWTTRESGDLRRDPRRLRLHGRPASPRGGPDTQRLPRPAVQRRPTGRLLDAGPDDRPGGGRRRDAPVRGRTSRSRSTMSVHMPCPSARPRCRTGPDRIGLRVRRRLARRRLRSSTTWSDSRSDRGRMAGRS